MCVGAPVSKDNELSSLIREWWLIIFERGPPTHKRMAAHMCKLGVKAIQYGKSRQKPCKPNGSVSLSTALTRGGGPVSGAGLTPDFAPALHLHVIRWIAPLRLRVPATATRASKSDLSRRRTVARGSEMDEREDVQGSLGTPTQRKLLRRTSTAADNSDSDENSDGVEEEARRPHAHPHLRDGRNQHLCTTQHACPALLCHLTTGLGWCGGGGTPSAHGTSRPTPNACTPQPSRGRPSC